MEQHIPTIDIDIWIPEHVTPEMIFFRASSHPDWKTGSKGQRQAIVVAAVRHWCRVSINGGRYINYDKLTKSMPEGDIIYRLIKKAANIVISGTLAGAL